MVKIDEIKSKPKSARGKTFIKPKLKEVSNPFDRFANARKKHEVSKQK